MPDASDMAWDDGKDRSYFHPALILRSKRWDIDCGLSGKVIVITYGDNRLGIGDHLVLINHLYIDNTVPKLDVFCHTCGKDEVLRIDRVHRVDELNDGGFYNSFMDWLKSYGINVKIWCSGKSVRVVFPDYI